MKTRILAAAILLQLSALSLQLFSAAPFVKELPGFKYGENASLEATAYDYISQNVKNPAALKQLAADIRTSLANSKNTDANAVALWILGIIGTDADVPFIAAQLSDKTNYYNATTALQQLATPTAVEALAQTLSAATGDTHSITLINALGWSHSPAAVPALRQAAASSKPAVAAAARQSLADNRTPEAAAVLGEISPEIAAIPQLEIARNLARAGNPAVAAPLLKKLLENTKIAPQIHTEAIRVSLDHQLPFAPSLIKQLAAKTDPETRDLLLPYYTRLPVETRDRIIGQLKAAPDSDDTAVTLGVIINQLTADEALPFIHSANETTRIAAQRQTALTADAATTQILLDNYLKADDSSAKNLLATLVAIPAENADAPLARTYARANDETAKIKLHQLIKARAATALAPAILGTLPGTTGKLRLTALDALTATGAVDTQTAVNLVLAAAANERGLTLNTLKTTYRKSTDQAAAIRPVLDALGKTGGPVRETLIAFAAETGNPDALETLWKIYDQSDADAKAALLRSIAKWPDAAPVDRLTQIAKNEKPNATPNLRILALRAAIDQLTRDTRQDAAARLAKTQALAAYADRKEERLGLLSVASDIPLKSARAFINTYDQYDDLKNETLAAKKAHNATLKKASSK